jgi:arylsulfatase A-like enzyme
MKPALILACWTVLLGVSLGAAERPNLLVILVDDLRWDDLGCAGHPFSKTPHIDRIAREGASFANAFAVTPLCSPSRATLLTGLYPHAHGITDNTDRSRQSHELATFPRALQAGGYETAFIGKWHMGNDDSPRPGFDHWVCLKGQGSSFDPEINVNGKATRESGHVTDALHRHALEFARRDHAKPFLLYFAHKALHPETAQRADGSLSDPNASDFIPAKRHQDLYAGAKVPRRLNALDAPQGKPALLRRLGDLPPLGPATGSSDASILGRLRMLAGVDESVGGLLAALEESGQLDRTLVVITSDHGYFYGEHGLSVERRLAYEESIRIPLLMRLPGLIPAGGRPEPIALTIDLAPTLLDLAETRPAAPLPGRSLVPVLKNEAVAWRREFLIEYYSDKVFPRISQMGYRALRDDRWKLIHYTELDGMDELYDLETDPFEKTNRIDDPAVKQVLDDLRARLARLAPP